VGVLVARQGRAMAVGAGSAQAASSPAARPQEGCCCTMSGLLRIVKKKSSTQVAPAVVEAPPKDGAAPQQPVAEQLPFPLFAHAMATAREQTHVPPLNTRSAWRSEFKDENNLMRTSPTKTSCSSWHAVRIPTYQFSKPWPPGDRQISLRQDQAVVYGRPLAWQARHAGNARQSFPSAHTGTSSTVAYASTMMGAPPPFNLDLQGTRELTGPTRTGSGEPSTGRTVSTEGGNFTGRTVSTGTGGDSTDDDSWPAATNFPALNNRIRKRPLPHTVQADGVGTVSAGMGAASGMTRRKSLPVHTPSPREHDVLLEEIAVRPADAECLCIRCAMEPQKGGLPSLSLVGTWARARHSAAAARAEQEQRQQQQKKQKQQQLQQQLHQLEQRLRSTGDLTKAGGVSLNLRQDYEGVQGRPVIESVTL